MTAQELAQAVDFAALTKQQIFAALVELAKQVEGWPTVFDVTIRPENLSKAEAVVIAALVTDKERLARLNARFSGALGPIATEQATAVLAHVLANPGAKQSALLPLVNNDADRLRKILKFLTDTGRISPGFSAGTNPAPVGTLD